MKGRKTMLTSKRIKWTCIICAVAMLISSAAIFAAEDMGYDYLMSVNEDNVIKVVDNEMYGTNMEWSVTNATDYYLAPNTRKTDSHFIENYKNRIPLSRMAGSSSQEFKWKNSLGEMSNRLEQSLWGLKGKAAFGFEEWLNAVKAADEDAKFTYVVNILNDSYENMADAIEFLRGDGKINYNGGENWAQKRIDMGIVEPVDIYVFEIGNEVDLRGKDIDWYLKQCKHAISAIRSVDKTTPISVHSSTYADPKMPVYTRWHQTLLEEIGDDIDYISNHFYYTPGKVTDLESRLSDMGNDIKKITGSDRIKIYQSEHATTRNSEKTTAGYDFVMPHTMMGTITTAEFFLRMMWYPQVTSSTYHSTHSSSWCIAYREDGTMKSTAIGDLLHMFINNGTGEVVESTFSGFEKLKATDVMGQAIKSEDGLNLILTNRTEEEKTIKLAFNGEYALKSYSYIQSNDYKADNYVGTKGINVDTVKVDSNQVITEYKLPKYSVVTLNLKKLEETE